MSTRKSPPRKTHKFQLRQDHAEDCHVQEIIEYWKSKKQGVTHIRKAILLLYALEQGDDSLLTSMFPNRAGQVQPMFPDAATIVQALDRLNDTLVRTQVAEPAPKKMNVPQLAMPVFEEDDEPALLIHASTSTDSSVNFVTALKNMQ